MAATLPASPHSIGGLRRSFTGVRATFASSVTSRRCDSQPRVQLCLKKEGRTQKKQNWQCAFASNTNPSPSEERTQGPPLLTILAEMNTRILE
ncbi:uncharacterized protein LOC127260656 isoform X2 [Andrographis paniculata]|uniref:uncharacterized protein LOC127260656 isoform X2 n=1 Tax=Andrographis paniculata TaxID=175694 RepID=UPI0021E83DAB|nr:uncharacterized protein LOC127260656 isoform X2 [Andrographis paniculata]